MDGYEKGRRLSLPFLVMSQKMNKSRSEERRVGKEC